MGSTGVRNDDGPVALFAYINAKALGVHNEEGKGSCHVFSAHNFYN